MSHTKYRAYFRNNDKVYENYLKSDTLDELLILIKANNYHIDKLPPHYLKSILENDANKINGRICCWGDLEIIKGEDQMTEYTSL